MIQLIPVESRRFGVEIGVGVAIGMGVEIRIGVAFGMAVEIGIGGGKRMATFIIARGTL